MNALKHRTGPQNDEILHHDFFFHTIDTLKWRPLGLVSAVTGTPFSFLICQTINSGVDGCVFASCCLSCMATKNCCYTSLRLNVPISPSSWLSAAATATAGVPPSKQAFYSLHQLGTHNTKAMSKPASPPTLFCGSSCLLGARSSCIHLCLKTLKSRESSLPKVPPKLALHHTSSFRACHQIHHFWVQS